MAISTRTRFESTPATVTPATVTGARQPANVITRRSTLARAAQQAQQATANPQRPALGGAGGTVQRLGGEPLPPRAQQSDGAVPVGGAVQRNQGIAQGGAAGRMPMPFAPAPDLNSALLVEGVPTAANARARRSVDFAVDTLTETLYRWDSTGGDDELGAWVPVGGGLEERTIGIQTPVAGNHYPIMAVAPSRFLLVSLTVFNRTVTGGNATPGTATVLVNGVAATLGTTEVTPGELVSLRVDTVGTGGVLYASVVARAV